MGEPGGKVKGQLPNDRWGYFSQVGGNWTRAKDSAPIRFHECARCLGPGRPAPAASGTHARGRVLSVPRTTFCQSRRRRSIHCHQIRRLLDFETHTPDDLQQHIAAFECRRIGDAACHHLRPATHRHSLSGLKAAHDLVVTG